MTQTGTFLPADNLLERKFNLQNTPGYISNFQRGKGYLKFTNTNQYPITLYKNQVVGTFEQIQQSSINTLNEVEDEQEVKHEQLPEPTNDQERLNKLYKDLNLDDLQKDLSQEEMTTLKNIISKYHHIFHLGDEDTLPEANLPPHKILLDTNKPVRTPYRQIPLALRQEAEKLVDDMVRKGIAERSNSPYHSPAFLIKKGDKHKLVIDYRKLNDHVIRNYQPLPRISDIISVWKNCKYWSTFDLSSAYHQIPLAKESRPLTACSIPGVAFISFRRVPLGLSSAVGYFQSLMETTFLGLKNKVLVAYLDDLLSATTDTTTMLTNIQLIFERLDTANLKLKPSKTKLFQKEVTFLGFKLSEKGQEITPEKVTAITQLQPPKNKKGVKSFMGFSSFFRKFIKGFATLMKPITELTKNGVPFIWGQEQQTSFETIKKCLTTAPILTFPDLTKPFVLTTDSSSIGIGAVLSQRSDDNFLHPIEFASNTLTEQQCRWDIFHKELYALVYYADKFKPYLASTKFLVRTDNQAVLHWRTCKDFDNPKLSRWFTKLSMMDFDIEYIPSAKNESDLLSRIPYFCQDSDKKKQNPPVIEKVNNIVKTTKPTPQTLPSSQQLKQAQEEDKNISRVIEWIKTGTKPEKSKHIQMLNPTLKTYFNSFNRLTISNGLLVRSWEKDNNEDPDDLICCPEKLTDEVIKTSHDIPSGGHLGKPKTIAKIRARFYWPQMQKEIELYIDACQTCIRKATKKKRVSPLQPFNGTYPGDIVNLDLAVDLPHNKYNYRNILVIVDHFTGWSEFIPLKDATAHTVARAFIDNWICRHSVPTSLISDRGSCFTSEVMKIVCDLMGIHKAFSCAYRPMTDGLAESHVKICKNLLKAFCMDKGSAWPDLLQQCVFAYRTSKNSTGYSPFFLEKGRSPRLALDLMYGTFNSEKFKSQQEYAYNLYKTLKDTHSFVEDKLQTNRDSMKVQYDKRANAQMYNEGEYVYLWRPKKPGRKHKLTTNFIGPFRIIKRISDYTYKIDTGNSRIHNIVPHDLLRLAVNYDPESQGRIDYDELGELEWDHDLDFTPMENLVEEELQIQERPVITLSEPNNNPEPQPRQLRNRQALRPPDIFQAGFD